MNNSEAARQLTAIRWKEKNVLKTCAACGNQSKMFKEQFYCSSQCKRRMQNRRYNQRRKEMKR